MKTLKLLSFVSFAALVVFVACTADDMRPPSTSEQQHQTIGSGTNSGNSQYGPVRNSNGSLTGRVASVLACNNYDIALESMNPVGSNWEWIWTVTNVNPGNGNNGTVQNLSHWGMQF